MAATEKHGHEIGFHGDIEEHEAIKKPQDVCDPSVPRPEDRRGDGLVRRTSRSTTAEGGGAVLAGEVPLWIGGEVSVEEQNA
jgi:hypothetical protein